MDGFHAHELALNQRHEIIIARREHLLGGIDGFKSHKEKNNAAKTRAQENIERNKQWRWDLKTKQQQLSDQANMSTECTNSFYSLKDNYWSMVKQVYPIWQREYTDFINNQTSHLYHQNSKTQATKNKPLLSPKFSNFSPRKSYRTRTPSPIRMSERFIENSPATSTKRGRAAFIRKSY